MRRIFDSLEGSPVHLGILIWTSVSLKINPAVVQNDAIALTFKSFGTAGWRAGVGR